MGLFGSLSRSDFGFLPLSIFVASLVLYRISRNKGAVRASFSGLFGASLGVLLVFAHNYIFSNHFLQTSARMKSYWGQIYGISHKRVIGLIFRIVGVNYSFVLIVLVVLLFAVLAHFIVSGSTKNKRVLPGFGSLSGIHERLLELTLVTSASLCIVGYLFVYAYVWPLQPWYSGNLIVPVFVILVTAAGYFDNVVRSDRRQWIRLGISSIVLGIVVHNMMVIHSDLSNSPWPYQQIMLKAGRYLNQHPPDGKIASWNAGIIGYYQGGYVINVDGLVNDDIYAYAVNNRLPVYLLQQDVRYIIDFENMFSDEALRLSGGYDDDVFLNSLQPIKVFDDGQYGWWKYMTLYRLPP
ncbi:MAG: hypothetical protein GXP40_03230 [Chloroflexi bacterium]|nr:hypothetical protein [Chloroflexota bacterium]